MTSKTNSPRKIEPKRSARAEEVVKDTIQFDVNRRVMVKACTNCNEVIKGNLILNCACNHTFCSQECCTDFHSPKNPNTTAEGVKIGYKTNSTVTPKVMAIQVNPQSSDTNINWTMCECGHTNGNHSRYFFKDSSVSQLKECEQCQCVKFKPKHSPHIKPSNSVIGKTDNLSVNYTPDNGTKVDTILSKRKELDHITCRVCALFPYALYTHKEIMLKKLEGFNLGVEMARKEFLDFIESWWNSNGLDIAILDKIKELKQQLERGGKE